MADILNLLSFHIKTFVEESCNNLLLIHIDNTHLEYDEDDEDMGFLGMIMKAIQFAYSLLQEEDDDYERENSNQIYTILLYMIITTEQEDLLNNDPNQFISDEDNEFSTKELKNYCMDFIIENIENHEGISVILSAVERLLLQPVNENYNLQTPSSDSKNYIYQNDSPKFKSKCIEVGLY